MAGMERPRERLHVAPISVVHRCPARDLIVPYCDPCLSLSSRVLRSGRSLEAFQGRLGFPQVLWRSAPALTERQRLAFQHLMDEREELWHAQACQALFYKLDSGFGPVPHHGDNLCTQGGEPRLTRGPRYER